MNTVIEHDLAEDLNNSEMILTKIKDPRYAQNLYAALCNMQWQKSEAFPILKDELWACTWRSSGGIIAELRDCGEDYMDWYCSGMGGLSDYHDSGEFDGYVSESTVTDEIRADLASLGWHPVPYDD